MKAGKKGFRSMPLPWLKRSVDHMDSRKTLVIGASTNPERYSYRAINLLRQYGHEVLAIGIRRGEVADVGILTERFLFPDIHTVTLYIGPQHQPEYYGYIEKLKPSRVIFNPGTENPEFEKRLKNAGIQVEVACTLVLLSTGQF